MITEDEWQWTHSDGISLWPGELKKQIRKVHLQLAFIFTKTLHVYCLTIYMYCIWNIRYCLLLHKTFFCFYLYYISWMKFHCFIFQHFIIYHFDLLYGDTKYFFILYLFVRYSPLWPCWMMTLPFWLGCIVTLNIGPSDILIRHVH